MVVLVELIWLMQYRRVRQKWYSVIILIMRKMLLHRMWSKKVESKDSHHLMLFSKMAPKNQLQIFYTAQVWAQVPNHSNSDCNNHSPTILKGFKSSLPFLSEDCGIRVDDNYLSPLFKHCINIKHPTMLLIGYPCMIAVTQVVDIQVNR